MGDRLGAPPPLPDQGEVQRFGVFELDARHRLMIAALPLGLSTFLLVLLAVAVREASITWQFLLFYSLFAMLTGLAVTMLLHTAHWVRLLDDAIIAKTQMRQVRISLADIVSVESVDRGPDDVVRNLVLISGPTTQFLILGSMRHFDCFMRQFSRRIPRDRVLSMPLWKRLLLLQWGV